MLKREPNFENMLKVLRREVPDRPVLYEFAMNGDIYERLTGRALPKNADIYETQKWMIDAFAAGGYDYAPIPASGFHFLPDDFEGHTKGASRSLNEKFVFTDSESYEGFKWNEPKDYEDDRVERAAKMLPDGMKLKVKGPGGVMENLIDLIGFDNLCYMLYDEPELVEEVSEQIGKRLYQYYEPIVQNDAVGFLCMNDDWGFNTQTFLAPKDLRKYVFPWNKKIVDLAHKYNKPIMLHSCGYFTEVIDDICDDMKFDARHSYEDNIMPVEEAYEKYHDRIAILGGIDVNFICRETPENIYRRSREMLERTADRGGYALGSGNSIPAYIPVDGYMAMVKAAWDFK